MFVTFARLARDSADEGDGLDAAATAATGTEARRSPARLEVLLVCDDAVAIRDGVARRALRAAFDHRDLSFRRAARQETVTLTARTRLLA